MIIYYYRAHLKVLPIRQRRNLRALPTLHSLLLSPNPSSNQTPYF